MHVVFIEPSFPHNQRQFVRALAAAGARVTGIGESPAEALDGEIDGWLYRYERVGSVVDGAAVLETVRRIGDRDPVARLEATVEAHIQAAAWVREQAGIPGTSQRTAELCRDKPKMKQALREAGVPCAESDAAGSPDEVRDFASRVGYPIVVKPRDAAGGADTHRVDSDDELDAALQGAGFEHGRSVAVEEFVEGHEGFYDTICIDGEVAVDFACHYFPNVLEALRTRWITPQIVVTNRIDDAPHYREVRQMGARVIEALGIETSASHMEWFFGPKGLKFSEIGCRPPGVSTWDLYCAADEIDLYREWANAVVHGRTARPPSRRFAAGIVNLRPDRDGAISHCDGLDEIQRRYGEWVIDCHIPNPGTPTQPVGAGYMANGWIRMRHPDYDELRSMLDRVGEIVQLRAR